MSVSADAGVPLIETETSSLPVSPDGAKTTILLGLTLTMQLSLRVVVPDLHAPLTAVAPKLTTTAGILTPKFPPWIVTLVPALPICPLVGRDGVGVAVLVGVDVTVAVAVAVDVFVAVAVLVAVAVGVDVSWGVAVAVAVGVTVAVSVAVGVLVGVELGVAVAVGVPVAVAVAVGVVGGVAGGPCPGC